MPGEKENPPPETFREARKQGRVKEFRESKRGPKKKPTTDTDSFHKTDVSPGSVIAGKEFPKNSTLERIIIRATGLVASGVKIIGGLERNGERMEWKMKLQEGRNEKTPSSLWSNLQRGDFIKLKLVTETQEITPIQEILTTFVVTHD